MRFLFLWGEGGEGRGGEDMKRKKKRKVKEGKQFLQEKFIKFSRVKFFIFIFS